MSRRSHRWRQAQRGPRPPGGAAPRIGQVPPSPEPRPATPSERPASSLAPTTAASLPGSAPMAVAPPVPSSPVAPADPPGAVASAADADAPAAPIAVPPTPRPPGPLASAPVVGPPTPSPGAPSPGAPSSGSPLHPAQASPAEGQSGCTAAQLRRFIKSRAYVPLHELRRRFELPGSEDDVNPLTVDGRRLFAGLPRREATLLGELLGAGDVGCELLLDPAVPLIIGVFPMRPVPRG